MSHQALVSVIIPTYNSSKYIEKTLVSVLHQTYINLEVIIVDDASTDNTISLLESLQKKDARIVIAQLEENSGAAGARNHATKLAKGDYIAFLDSDDLWLPNKIEQQLALFKKADCGVVFSSYYCMNEEGQPLNIQIKALERLDYAKVLRANYIGNLTGMYSVKKLGKLYAPMLRKRQDWALWMQAIKISGAAYSVQEPLAVYRIRTESVSSGKWSLLKYNFAVYKQFLGFSTVKSLYWMVLFLYEHFLVKRKLQVKEQFTLK